MMLSCREYENLFDYRVILDQDILHFTFRLINQQFIQFETLINKSFVLEPGKAFCSIGIRNLGSELNFRSGKLFPRAVVKNTMRKFYEAPSGNR